jgi:hypothetical protein
LLAYESRRVVRRVLQHNLAANEARNVTVMRRQLGGGPDTVERPDAPQLPTADLGAPDDPIFETVDGLQLERLQLLKINEGLDAMAILGGAADTLWRLRPLLFIAVSDRVALTEAAMRARDHGYRCWKVETPVFNPNNFNGREDDIFAGRTALALLAIPEEAKADIAFEGCVEL